MLARSLKSQRGVGHYFNSGSWATLMQITPAVRQDAERFAKLFKLLDGGQVPVLRAAKPELVLSRRTAVRVWRDGDHAARAALLQVHTGPGGIRAETDEKSACSFGMPAPAAAAPSSPAPKA